MKIRVLILIIFIYSGCCPCLKKTKSQKVVIGGSELLYGEISRAQLFYDYPEWLDIYENFKPNLLQCDTLARIKRDIHIEIFLGTWCFDSKREVPRFFRILDQTGSIGDEKVTLYGVDPVSYTHLTLPTTPYV